MVLLNTHSYQKMRCTVTKKADMVIDLQYGSTGKGLIAGYLACKNKYDVVVTANMPNAGHTFIDHHHNEMIHKVLPNGIVSPNCKWALIGPGAVFDLDRLINEMEYAYDLGYDHFKIGIHPNAVMLNSMHAAQEVDLVKIGSTMQGSAAAMVQKIQRNPENNPTAAEVLVHFRHDNIIILNQYDYRHILQSADNILLEGAQGFSLGINQMFYPYCTSRECTPTRFLSDMGIPIGYLRKVIGTARVHPIRVGSPSGGYSGDCYGDQEELGWENFGVEPERTTVTNRIRRIFSWSRDQVLDAIWETQPDEIFLNFCNYATPEELNMIRNQIGGLIAYEGWGATVFDVKEIYRG